MPLPHPTPENPSILSGLGPGSASTLQGPSPTPGPKASINSPDGSHSTPLDLGMPAVYTECAGQGHRAANLPFVNLGAKRGHTMTSWKMLPSPEAGHLECLCLHPVHQFRFFVLQEGEPQPGWFKGIYCPSEVKGPEIGWL